MLSRESGDNITKQGYHGYHEYHSIEQQRVSVVVIENDGYQGIPRLVFQSLDSEWTPQNGVLI